MPSFWGKTGDKNAFLGCHLTQDSYYHGHSWYGVGQRCATLGLTEINLGFIRGGQNFMRKSHNFETFDWRLRRI